MSSGLSDIGSFIGNNALPIASMVGVGALTGGIGDIADAGALLGGDALGAGLDASTALTAAEIGSAAADPMTASALMQSTGMPVMEGMDSAAAPMSLADAGSAGGDWSQGIAGSQTPG